MAKATLYSKEMIAEYTEKGYWGPLTFADIWDQKAKDCPDREAIVDAKGRITWLEVKQRTDRLALGLLETGLERDEMIVLQLPNWVELFLFRIACEKAGVLSLAVPPAMRQKEMEYILGKVEAAGIVMPWEYHCFDYFGMIEELRPGLPRLKHIFIAGHPAPSGAISVENMSQQPLEEKYPPHHLNETKFGPLEFSWVQLTTGTTGFPKFIEAPICGRIHCAREWASACKLTEDDVCGLFALGPVGPNFISNMAAPLIGAKIVMLERFEAGEALGLIEEEKITLVGIVPTMLVKMITHPDFDNFDLSSLRAVLLTGAPLSKKLALEGEEKLGRLVQVYGTVDYGGITAPHVDVPQEVRLFSVNRFMTGNQAKLVDESGSEVAPGEAGEVVIRGPSCNSGFYKDPEATWQIWDRDGWFQTGDLGKFDDEGNLIIVGRKKDIIIRGGQNILPAEIEQMLSEHPKVANVAVVGMPDPVMGEKACAYIVLKEGQQLSFEEMLDALRAKKIASYKLPERLEILADLPVVPGSEKVDKKVLARDIAEKIRAEQE